MFPYWAGRREETREVCVQTGERDVHIENRKEKREKENRREGERGRSRREEEEKNGEEGKENEWRKKGSGENPNFTCTPWTYVYILCHALRPNTGTVDEHTHTQAQSQHTYTLILYTLESCCGEILVYMYFMSLSAVEKLRSLDLGELYQWKFQCIQYIVYTAKTKLLF